jgi:hypothetical protein
MFITRIKTSCIVIFSVFVMAMSLLSCEEDEEVVRQPGQLFRPVLFTSEADAGQVVLSWVPIKNAAYLLEISRDNLQFTVDLQSFSLEAGTEQYVLSNLQSGETYSARIKSVSQDLKISDSEFAVITFVAP